MRKVLNISGGLKQIKQFKNELKRKIKIRKENFSVIIPKDNTLNEFKRNIKENVEFVEFSKISEDIDKISGEISDLRERIMKTNINTIIEVNGDTITLSKLKLLIDDLKSKLAQLEVINDKDYFGVRRRRIATTEEEEKEVAQLTDLQLDELIKQIETDKITLENILETKNATTQLIE